MSVRGDGPALVPDFSDQGSLVQLADMEGRLGLVVAVRDPPSLATFSLTPNAGTGGEDDSADQPLVAQGFWTATGQWRVALQHHTSLTPGIASARGRRPVALAVAERSGALGIRGTLIAVVTEDYSVLCLDGALEMVWQSTMHHPAIDPVGVVSSGVVFRWGCGVR